MPGTGWSSMSAKSFSPSALIAVSISGTTGRNSAEGTATGERVGVAMGGRLRRGAEGWRYLHYGRIPSPGKNHDRDLSPWQFVGSRTILPPAADPPLARNFRRFLRLCAAGACIAHERRHSS